MTFLEFIQTVETAIRMPNNASIRPQLKILTNESIFEFARMREWLRLQAVFEFTTGKSSFSITAFTSVGSNIITVSGTNWYKFKKGDILTVAGSVSNNGDYTVVTAVANSSNTDITVTENFVDTDATGTPTLTTNSEDDYRTPDDFVNDIGLYNSAGSRVDKKYYKEYIQSSTSVWALLADVIQIGGDIATYELIYISRGDTLSDDADTSNVLDHYSDIIKQWVVYSFYIWYGADETAAREEIKLKNKIQGLMINEARMDKNGRHFKIGVQNR
jgi:hypothetical protein